MGKSIQIPWFQSPPTRHVSYFTIITSSAFYGPSTSAATGKAVFGTATRPTTYMEIEI